MPFPATRALATLLTALAVGMPAAANAGGPLDPYLPASGAIVGHVISFSIAPENQAISRQFRHAVQDNMDWFKKAVTSNKPGQPLPYDRRMGITEAQYQQLQHMKSEAHEGEAVKVAVKRDADGSIGFSPEGEAAQALKDVKFPPDEKTAVTPFGTLSILTPIHQADAAAPIGVWNGNEWAQVELEQTDGDKPSAKIAFGKREADGSGVMYVQVAPYKDHKEQSLVVFYALN